MSFALAHQSKNKQGHNKTSTPVKRSSHGGGVNLAMTSHDSIIHLQQTIGNQAIQRLLRSNARNDARKTDTQRKLKVSEPGDVYEQEADKVAEQVMRMSGSNHIHSIITNKKERIDRKCSACEMKKTDEEEEKKLNISRTSSTTTKIETSSEAANKISNVRSSPGSSLDHNTQVTMESGFGYDFGNVRIHADANAAESARSVNALAYTIGKDIVFGGGQYSPSTVSGRRLIAHELAHVVEQGGRKDSDSLQRAGAGNCAEVVEDVDEQRDEMFRVGRLAHAQIQGFFSTMLDSEVQIPRATKDARATNCPSPNIPIGKADLWDFGGGFSDVSLGEIKSINGQKYAPPDVIHYLTRLKELAGRFKTGTPCPGPADNKDQKFDKDWLTSVLSTGNIPHFKPLDRIVPPAPTYIGPFLGNPLKSLYCQLSVGGGVLYWCTKPRSDKAEENTLASQGERSQDVEMEKRRRARGWIALDHDYSANLQKVVPSITPGRTIVFAIPLPLYREVQGARYLAQNVSRMRVEQRNHPLFQARVITWAIVGSAIAAGTLALVLTAISVAPAAQQLLGWWCCGWWCCGWWCCGWWCPSHPIIWGWSG